MLTRANQVSSQLHHGVIVRRDSHEITLLRRLKEFADRTILTIKGATK
jgi:hypothetical protein